MLEYGAESWKGGRDYQEDSFCILDMTQMPGPHRATLFVVADGMGGHSGGDVASTTVLRAVTGSWLQAKPSGLRALQAGIEAATQALEQCEAEDELLHGLGSTLIAVILTDAGIEWVSVGDSPLWVLRGGALHRLNADHSGKPMLEQMAAAGEITQEQARQDPTRHQLRSAITSSFPRAIDVSPQPTPLLPGDLVLLASDGLQTLDDEEIAAVCATEKQPSQLCRKLLQAVKAKAEKRQDNATVVAFRFSRESAVETIAAARKAPESAPSPTGGDSRPATARPPSPDGDRSLGEAKRSREQPRAAMGNPPSSSGPAGTPTTARWPLFAAAAAAIAVSLAAWAILGRPATAPSGSTAAPSAAASTESASPPATPVASAPPTPNPASALPASSGDPAGGIAAPAQDRKAGSADGVAEGDRPDAGANGESPNATLPPPAEPSAKPLREGTPLSEAPSEPQPARLLVTTAPKGARVLADGRTAGRSGEVIELPPGSYTLGVELPNHTGVPAGKKVTLVSGQETAVSFELCKQRARKGCVGNSPHWFDSCGTKGEALPACASGEKCIEGACAAPKDNCAPRTSTRCINGMRHFVNSCGEMEEPASGPCNPAAGAEPSDSAPATAKPQAPKEAASPAPAPQVAEPTGKASAASTETPSKATTPPTTSPTGPGAAAPQKGSTATDENKSPSNRCDPPQHHRMCHEGDIYWANACNTPTSLMTPCGSGRCSESIPNRPKCR